MLEDARTCETLGIDGHVWGNAETCGELCETIAQFWMKYIFVDKSARKTY